MASRVIWDTVAPRRSASWRSRASSSSGSFTVVRFTVCQHTARRLRVKARANVRAHKHSPRSNPSACLMLHRRSETVRTNVDLLDGIRTSVRSFGARRHRAGSRRLAGRPSHGNPSRRQLSHAYVKARPSIRRRVNEAVLEAVYVKDRKIARAKFTEVFEPLFSRPSSNKTMEVDPRGFEPLTFWLPARRSTS
jgi:hypothetical protein